MKSLIFSSAIIVGLSVFSLFVGLKGVNRYDDIQILQYESHEFTGETISVAVSQTKLLDGVMPAVKRIPAETISVTELKETTPDIIASMMRESPYEKGENDRNKEIITAANIGLTPGAIPVLSPEEAAKANTNAMSFYDAEEINRRNSPIIKTSESKPAPAAVPVLSPEEAMRANQVATRIQKSNRDRQLLLDRIRKMGTSKSFLPLSLLLALLPLLFISDAILFRKKQKTSKKGTTGNYFSLQRRCSILLSVSLLVFGLFVFVPWSIYFGNSSQFPFIFQDYVNFNLILLGISVAALTFLLLIIPPKISDYFVAIVAGLGICIYIQAMFMNCYLGDMDGVEQEWSQHRLWGVVNLLIWCIVILSPVILKLVFRDNYSKLISALSGFILFLEVSATVSMVASAPEDVWIRNDKFVCDASCQFQFSKEKNIIFLILDALGGALVEPCLDADPQVKAALKDFSVYSDACCVYNYTYPALVHELTGAIIKPAGNQEEVFEQTWHYPSTAFFYEQMKKAGYDPRIFIQIPTKLGSEEHYRDYFSNIKEAEFLYKINYPELFYCLFQMSGFSSMPYSLKHLFFYADDFSYDTVQQYTLNKIDSYLPIFNNTYHDKMISKGLSTDSDSPVFAIHYTRGAHNPWKLDERLNVHNPPFEDILPSARSCFFLLTEIVDLLKKNGIYDQTAIVVCSDHNSRSKKYNYICDMTLMVKPFNSNNNEIIFDDRRISSLDIVPTILQMACGKDVDTGVFEGLPVSDIPPDRMRTIYRLATLQEIPVLNDVNGKPTPFGNCFAEFEIDTVRTFKIKKKFFVRIIPWNNTAEVDEKTLTTFPY